MYVVWFVGPVNYWLVGSALPRTVDWSSILLFHLVYFFSSLFLLLVLFWLYPFFVSLRPSDSLVGHSTKQSSVHVFK